MIAACADGRRIAEDRSRKTCPGPGQRQLERARATRPTTRPWPRLTSLHAPSSVHQVWTTGSVTRRLRPRCGGPFPMAPHATAKDAAGAAARRWVPLLPAAASSARCSTIGQVAEAGQHPTTRRRRRCAAAVPHEDGRQRRRSASALKLILGTLEARARRQVSHTPNTTVPTPHCKPHSYCNCGNNNKHEQQPHVLGRVGSLAHVLGLVRGVHLGGS